MLSLLSLILEVALVVAVVGVSVSLVRKAGYSGWYGLLSVIPVVNVIALIVFAMVQWPIERELCELRARCGINTEDAAESLFDEAARLEVKGWFEDALAKYQGLVERFPDSAASADAHKCMATLRSRIASLGLSGSPAH